MSVLDLARYQENVKEAQQAETVEQPQPLETPINQTTDESAANDSTVTIQGPLSNVYADALMKVYGEAARVSKECNMTEQIVILQYKQQQQDKPATQTSVFVTDVDHLEDESAESFDQLRVALDNKKSNRYVVIENFQDHRAISNKVGHILRYAHEHASRMFYSRERFIQAMK